MKLNMPKKLSNFTKLWLFAPVALWFSYWPSIKLGSNQVMNFEVSLALIYVLVLALFAIPIIFSSYKLLIKSKTLMATIILLAFSALSLAWTSSLQRGIVTLGVGGALVAILLASLVKKNEFKKIAPLLLRLVILTSLIASGLSVLQLLLGDWLGQGSSLLCNGCVATQFGFARPNLFTAEPQFLGNILLFPCLYLLHRLIKDKFNWAVGGQFLLVLIGLFLTLSRGAIFAFAIGVLFMVVIELRQLKLGLQLTTIAVVGFFTCMLLQGWAAAINPNVDTSFYKAVSTGVNQLSLGVIKLPEAKSNPSKIKLESNSQPKTNTLKAKKQPNFKGYVNESTDVRVKLSKLSLKLWSKTPFNAVFGVGLGGSGAVLRQAYPNQVNPREIVQNEFVERLLETGLLGFGLFIFLLIQLISVLKNHKWTWAIIVSYIVQWNFYSGYPNALHVYLLFIALAVILGSSKLGYTNKHD